MKILIAFAVFMALILPISVSAGSFDTPAKQECSYRKVNRGDNWRTHKCTLFILNMTRHVMEDKYQKPLKTPTFYLDFLSPEESRGARKLQGEGLLGWTDGTTLAVDILTPTPYFHQPIEMTMAHEFAHVFQGANKLKEVGSTESEIEARDASIEVYTLLFPWR